ncbi:MAG TPA: FMN-binding protein [Firmicutes bacterium]|nr:FMN-binding protein [Bacillota bacterium]
MKEILRLGLILMVICAVSAGALAYTNQVTSEIIEKRLYEEKIALLQELFPTVDTFEDKEADGRTATIGYDADGNLVGILAEGKTNGYGGEIRFNLGIDGEGKLVSLTIVSHSETAGLGSKIEEESYRNQFLGKTLADSFDVDNISGATISSVAVENGVKKEMEAILTAFGGELADVPPAIDISALPDGVYEGEGEGLMPGIKVKVTVAGGKITAIEVTNGDDTPEYFDKAKAEVPKRIIDEQSVQVDAASGATFSSQGIIDAVTNALQNAAAGPGVDISALPDGVYEGEGVGLMPGIKVKVTVAGGKITAIEVTNGDDTPEYFDKAKAEIPKRIIDEQSVQVDAVSGATFSSQGIMDAVTDALQQ